MVKMVVRYAAMMESTAGVVERGVIPGCQDVRWLGTMEGETGEYARSRSASLILAVVVEIISLVFLVFEWSVVRQGGGQTANVDIHTACAHVIGHRVIQSAAVSCTITR